MRIVKGRFFIIGRWAAVLHFGIRSEVFRLPVFGFFAFIG